MKIITFSLILMICQLVCYSQNNTNGIFKERQSGKKLKLGVDGSYILYNPEGNGHFEMAQCSIASKGKWKKLSGDVLEITSENHYLKQPGFIYQLKKENRLSPDSLYININLPDSLLYYKNGIPVSFSIVFNNNVSKSIFTNKAMVVLSKKKYLFGKT